MLEVRGIAKSYGKKEVLRDVTFTARPGEQIAIIGNNGCGKTTLLRILAGVDPCTSGRISFFGQDAGKNPRVFRKYAGYLPQENPLLSDLTVLDNLRLWSGKSGMPDAWLISEFHLEDLLGVKTGKLSGGMKRRVAAACAVALLPPVVFMDEPTASLDLACKRDLRAWMRSYREKNSILVLATHDPMEMKESGRVLLLESGTLRELGGDALDAWILGQNGEAGA